MNDQELNKVLNNILARIEALEAKHPAEVDSFNRSPQITAEMRNAGRLALLDNGTLDGEYLISAIYHAMWRARPKVTERYVA